MSLPSCLNLSWTFAKTLRHSTSLQAPTSFESLRYTPRTLPTRPVSRRISSTYFSFCSFSFLRTHLTKAQPPGAEKGTACLHINVLREARPSTLRKHGIKDTPREHTRDASYIFGSLFKVGRFSHKAKYARLRTPRGPRMGFRESFSCRPSVRPQVKVSPSKF